MNGSVWMSLPSSRKWRLTAFPGAAGGDAHLLVVVADRAAGREGVAQPEAVSSATTVGDVGEGRGALVGRHDEVGIVAVVDDHIRGGITWRRRVQVVGDVQEAGEEQLVGGDRLGPHGVAPAGAFGICLG